VDVDAALCRMALDETQANVSDFEQSLGMFLPQVSKSLRFSFSHWRDVPGYLTGFEGSSCAHMVR
jgi:hypothetical protein